MDLIDPQEVNRLVRHCLFKDDELEAGLPKRGVKWVKVSGIVKAFGFVKDRLDEIEESVTCMLMNLPVGFREGTGEGWSFLKACEDKNGD